MYPGLLPTQAKPLLAALLLCVAGLAQGQAVRLQTVAEGLEHPWSLAFLPGGRFLVTERPGRLRVVEADGRVGPPVGHVPQVMSQGQGGLLDVALDPDFERNRTLYFCFSEQPPGSPGNHTALARAQLPAGEVRLGVCAAEAPHPGE